MKKHIIFIITALCIACVVNSCDTDGKYEVEDTLVTVGANIAYLENPTARYRLDFGTTKLSDSLPYLVNGVLILKANPVYFKNTALTEDLRVWRLGASGTETLELTTPVTATANGFISLLQLSDSSPLTIYNPVAPPADKTTQTNVQLFYANAAQPQKVTVTVLAIDFLYFIGNGLSFTTLPANKKKEIANFTINKAVLSPNITLDLNLFNDINGAATAFFYKITDPVTGVVLQDYKYTPSSASTRINIIASSINPKYKFSLFQWDYSSPTVPFKATALIDGEEW
jgi:hypothetical protein